MIQILSKNSMDLKNITKQMIPAKMSMIVSIFNFLKWFSIKKNFDFRQYKVDDRKSHQPGHQD